MTSTPPPNSNDDPHPVETWQFSVDQDDIRLFVEVTFVVDEWIEVRLTRCRIRHLPDPVVEQLLEAGLLYDEYGPLLDYLAERGESELLLEQAKEQIDTARTIGVSVDWLLKRAIERVELETLNTKSKRYARGDTLFYASKLRYIRRDGVYGPGSDPADADLDGAMESTYANRYWDLRGFAEWLFADDLQQETTEGAEAILRATPTIVASSNPIDELPEYDLPEYDLPEYLADLPQDDNTRDFEVDLE